MRPAASCVWLLWTLAAVRGRASTVPGGRIVEGDIFIQAPQVARAANPAQTSQVTVMPGDSDTWTTREIPFSLHPSIDAAAVPTIIAAMTDISVNTVPPGGGLCLSFRPATPQDIDYVNITGDQSGCFSSVGRRGGQQILNIGPQCNARGVIEHELLHTLGFWHEHSRTDRDTYVQVLYGNIILGNEANFDKEVVLARHILPYDFDSIMHYKYNEFARSDDLDTILPRSLYNVDKTRLGQRKRLSNLDIQRVKWLYQCDHSYFCPQPVIADGHVTPDVSCYAVGRQVQVSCKDKHDLIGPQYKHCKSNGEWSGADSYCLDLSTTAGRRLERCDMEPACRLSQWRRSSVWKLRQGSSPANDTGPHTDHTTDNSTGSYLLWDSGTVSSYTRANFYTPVIRYSGNEGACVLFYYHIGGVGRVVPRMYVYVKYSRRTLHYAYRTAYRRVWTWGGQTSRAWQAAHACTTPPSDTAQYQVILYVYRGKTVPGQTADVAIDDVIVGPRSVVSDYRKAADLATGTDPASRLDKCMPTGYTIV